MSTSFDKSIATDDSAHQSANGTKVGFRPTNAAGRGDAPLISVEPPRREDLQPSYAQTLEGESEQGNHGWYGSMINTLGSCIGAMGAVPCCIVCPNPYKNVSQGNVGPPHLYPSLLLTMSTSFDKSIATDDSAHQSANGTKVGFRPTNAAGRGDAPLISVEPPRREDLQPSYAQTLEGESEQGNHGWYGSMINTLGSCIGAMGAVPCCIVCPNPYKNVSQGNVGLVTKFGRFYRAVDPGLVKINPLSERLIQVDVKIQIVEVPQQVCMTKDNVTLHLTSVIYYHITSPHKAAFGISNVRQALIERTQTTLRHVVGARVLQDVIERREEVAQSIGEIIEDVASGWGVQVESMLIKDMIFSNELQDSLSMAAQSKRIGESKVIAARAEVESAKLMRQAADILSSAPAMQIRYLEAMQSMAKSANSKVIFLPGAPTLSASMNMASALGEGSKDQFAGSSKAQDNNDFGGQDTGFQRAINAHVVQNI